MALSNRRTNQKTRKGRRKKDRALPKKNLEANPTGIMPFFGELHWRRKTRRLPVTTGNGEEKSTTSIQKVSSHSGKLADERKISKKKNATDKLKSPATGRGRRGWLLIMAKNWLSLSKSGNVLALSEAKKAKNIHFKKNQLDYNQTWFFYLDPLKALF